MRFEDDGIFEIESNALEGGVVDEGGISGVVLIEWEGVADEDGEGILFSSTCSTRLLTESGEGVADPSGASVRWGGEMGW